MEQKLKSKGDVFSFLEQISKQIAAGELLFQSGDQNGKIYVCDGKVAWAFATGQETSFQSILLNEKNFNRDTLVQGIQKSRDKGKRHLNDILLELEVDDVREREDVILRHSRSALNTMTSWPSCTVHVVKTEEPEESTGLSFTLDRLLPKTKEKTSQAPAQAFDSFEVFFEAIANGVPGFTAASLVDMETGTPIATELNTENFDLETASAFYRDVAKAAHEALVALEKAEVNSNPVQEILITGLNEYVVLRVLNQGQQLLYLLLDQSANPGVALVEVRKNLRSLEALLS